MISGIEKIRSDVFESCITSPETVVFTEMFVGIDARRRAAGSGRSA